MRSLFTLGTIGLLLIASSSTTSAQAGALWYNGDFDNRGSLTNENNVPINTGSGYVLQKSLVYDNFTVPTGQTWTITSVYSNDLVSYYVAPTTATWEIRSGVSAGNGGTLVASGDTTATLTPLSGISVGGYTAETVSASVPSIVLTAGTYWLAVAPDSAGYYGDQSFVMTTSGANSIGLPAGNDGNSFVSNTYPASGSASYKFTATTSVLNNRSQNLGPNIDFSMGVNGSFVVSVPEPASVAMVAFGLLGSLAWAKKRRTTFPR